MFSSGHLQKSECQLSSEYNSVDIQSKSLQFTSHIIDLANQDKFMKMSASENKQEIYFRKPLPPKKTSYRFSYIYYHYQSFFIIKARSRFFRKKIKRHRTENDTLERGKTQEDDDSNSRNDIKVKGTTLENDNRIIILLCRLLNVQRLCLFNLLRETTSYCKLLFLPI